MYWGCFKIVSIDGIMFGVVLGTADGIKLEMIESTDMISLISSPRRYINDRLGVSLNIIE